MISNTALINALRSIGYTFNKQTDRTMVWKKRGATDRAMIRRHENHSEEYARQVLRLAGMPMADIDDFVSSAKITTH